jgi:hypothetical protein
MALTFFEYLEMSPPEFGGDFDTALENYYQLAKRIGIRDGRVLKQIHGATIIGADGARHTRPILPLVVGEGDAIWTSEPGVWVGVFTADCLPILLDAGDRVMAVHAGWRSLAAGIIEKAVVFLGDRAGASVLGGDRMSQIAEGRAGASVLGGDRMSQIAEGGAAIRSAIVGPAAKKCCYEVGDEVIAAMRLAGIEPVVEGRNLDMVETGEAELRRLGVATITRSEPHGCTICDKHFRSFRRDRDRAGRSLSGIALERRE